MNPRMIRTYSEMRQHETFKERFVYLRLGGGVADETFGFDRYINQQFYRSREWKQARRDTLARDLGCDLGLEGYEIFSRALIHHINPITAEDIRIGADILFDPENLITVTHITHNAIHYGDFPAHYDEPTERRRGDTKLW